MICPECSGNGFIKLPQMSDPWAARQIPEVNCPTCEGQGKLSNAPAEQHCPTCGEPLEDGQGWCDEHRAAGLLEVS